jgi:5-hydroxytryptamine receptor 2
MSSLTATTTTLPFLNSSLLALLSSEDILLKEDSTRLTPEKLRVSLTEVPLNWWVLLLSSIVLIGVFGNVLVCLAICLERRLQNATNYFLLSLAVADLFVSILVMPMAILELLYGKFMLMIHTRG